MQQERKGEGGGGERGKEREREERVGEEEDGTIGVIDEAAGTNKIYIILYDIERLCLLL